MNRIVLAGGTGFIGQYLALRFKEIGYEVSMISRKRGDISWEDKKATVQALNNAEAVINLAGKSVNCRYTQKNKAAILASRIDTTNSIGSAIKECSVKPKLWLNASTATIYRHAEDRPMTEQDGEIGSGFSVQVARKWEEAFFSWNDPDTRQIALRMAIVLGKGGGVMKPLSRMVSLGLGGKQGKGSQMFSWIHIDDLFSIILFLMKEKGISGVINCSSPGPVSNDSFMAMLRKALHVRFGLPAPEWLLKIGAVLIRTETELIFKSRWVLPGHLLRNGYTFHYPYLQDALNEIIKMDKS